MSTNSNTPHSKALRAKTAKVAYAKAIKEGRIKRKNLCAPPDVIDEFVGHMNATGKKTDAEKLKVINKKLKSITKD